MSFNGIVTNQIENSHKRLSSIDKTAGYLLDGVFITLDKQGLEPLAASELSFQSVGALLESGSDVSIKDSNIFLDSTTKRIKDYCFEIVGRSPGLLEDIIKGIQKPVGDLIDFAVKPVQDGADAIIKSVQGIINNGVSYLQSGFDSATKTVTSWIQNGFKIIGEGVNFINSSINALLDGVATAFNFGILAIQQSFGFLISAAQTLFSFEMEDIMKLTDTMTGRVKKQQEDDLKKRAGVT